MSASAQQLLEDLRRKQGDLPQQDARSMLEDMRSEQDQPEPAKPNWAVRNISQPFNEGLVDMVNMPINLSNLLLNAFGGPQIPGTDELKASTASMGFTAPDGQREEGFIPESMRLMGGSAIPGAAVSTLGRNVLQRGIPIAERTVLQQLGASTAQAPKASAAADVIGSFSAGAGGEIAENTFPDNPNAKAQGQMVGGIALPAVPLAAGKLTQGLGWFLDKIPLLKAIPSATRFGVDAIKDVPYSFNASRRAANELQSRAVNPEQSAARIDPNSPMPPSLQAGDERLIALQNRVLEEVSPKEATAFKQHVESTTKRAAQDAGEFGGDPNLVRDMAETKSRTFIKQQQAKAVKAEKEATDAIAAAEPYDTAGNISTKVREKVETAEKAWRVTEKAAWSEVDSTAPGSYENTAKTVAKHLAEESPDRDMSFVPENVKKAISRESRINELSAKKPEDLTPEEIKFLEKNEVTFNDLHQVRQDIQSAKAKLAVEPGNAGRIRVLNDIEESLLNDMSATNVEGVEAARKVSLELNKRFTHGQMGKILGYSGRSTKAFDAAGTMDAVLSGNQPARNVKQLLEGAPDARGDVADYIRKRFIIQASDARGVVNPKTADGFIRNLKQNRLLDDDMFPEIEAELRNMVTKTGRAALAAERAALVKTRLGARLESGSNESVAMLMLKQDKGLEVESLFKPSTTKKAQLANRMRASMGQNPEAQKGLRTLYAKRLLREAESGTDEVGSGIISGANYTRLLRENKDVLKSLGFSPDEIGRMRHTSAILRQAQKKGAKTPTEVINDVQSALIDLPVSLVGAQIGGHMARQTAGGSLQMAGRGASFMRKFSKFLTRNKAERLLIDAHSDPELYKSLLLKPLGAKPMQFKAAEKRLNAWMLAVSSEAAEDAQED